MRRLWIFLLTLPLAACAGKGAFAPAPVTGAADPCAGVRASGLVDPRTPGLLGCANDANLRAMIADPRDLQAGVGVTGVSDEIAMGAAQRLRLGKTPPAGGSIPSSDSASNAAED